MSLPLILCKNICKSYYMGKVEVKALDNVSFSFPKGKFLAIVGPSGSGKSTLMNILGCLDTPDKGEYRLEDRLVNGLSSTELADLRNKKIGFIFQNFNLLSRYDVYANVELPLIYSGIRGKLRRKKVLEAIESVGLSDRIKHKPSELSGGQCQKVAIARALVNDPAIIFADEPTGNLDSVAGKEIISIFKKLVSQNKTVVMVTHDLNLASLTDGLIEMCDGHIINYKGL